MPEVSSVLVQTALLYVQDEVEGVYMTRAQPPPSVVMSQYTDPSNPSVLTPDTVSPAISKSWHVGVLRNQMRPLRPAYIGVGAGDQAGYWQ